MDIYYDDEVIRMGDDKTVIGEFVSCFTIVAAAGGVVKNERGEILFIYRRGKWDLPKGKVEGRATNDEGGIRKDEGRGTRDEGRKKKNEKRKASSEWRVSEAIREVKEETGLVEVEVIRKLQSTYHIYFEKGKQVLKETFWFEMVASGDQELAPQTEEEITEVRWFKIDELDMVLENTFESLKSMINQL